MFTFIVFSDSACRGMHRKILQTVCIRRIRHTCFPFSYAHLLQMLRQAKRQAWNNGNASRNLDCFQPGKANLCSAQLPSLSPPRSPSYKSFPQFLPAGPTLPSSSSKNPAYEGQGLNSLHVELVPAFATNGNYMRRRTTVIQLSGLTETKDHTANAQPAPSSLKALDTFRLVCSAVATFQGPQVKVLTLLASRQFFGQLTLLYGSPFNTLGLDEPRRCICSTCTKGLRIEPFGNLRRPERAEFSQAIEWSFLQVKRPWCNFWNMLKLVVSLASSHSSDSFFEPTNLLLQCPGTSAVALQILECFPCCDFSFVAETLYTNLRIEDSTSCSDVSFLKVI